MIDTNLYLQNVFEDTIFLAFIYTFILLKVSKRNQIENLFQINLSFLYAVFNLYNLSFGILTV